MNELDAILDYWRDPAAPTDAVLATVVHVKGSAYRRPGARMLIAPDGRRIGSISGGCLESDLVKKAWWLTEGGKPTLRVYDTTSDDDAVWEFGLGCNGVVQVLLERLDSPALQEALRLLAGCRMHGQPAVVATVIRSCDETAGARLLVTDEGVRGGTLHGSSLEWDLRRHARLALQERKSRLVHFETCEVFVEWIGPPQSLVVFGAGHDAIPLVAIASQLGWHVTVADGRPAYARPDRFPGAGNVVLLPRDASISNIAIGPDTAVVMMTHNFPQDQRLLPQILARRPRYLGLLGPRIRTERLLEAIGMEAPDVHAPVGLDIGGDTPESIALAIMAEAQAVVAGRKGGLLKLRQGSIHTAPAEAIESIGARMPAAFPAEITVCENAALHLVNA